MSFRAYLRWDGSLAIAVGIALLALGLANHHQGPLDATLSGLLSVAGTGIFMAVRHRAPLRRPGAWFTAKSLASAAPDGPARRRRSLLVVTLAETAASAAMTVGLSHLTHFWLTYTDFGVWALMIGVIKIGPSVAVITRYEARSGVTYRVARRPVTGAVELVATA